ncbi:hypothetical protein [Absidia glauca]|uniref:Galactose oxidase n=1 Tax=Absidia glauca TaxID=4829 RepID=A0A163KPP5_ABSGL|nr:hypothetical protein [Absidia glauca]
MSPFCLLLLIWIVWADATGVKERNRADTKIYCYGGGRSSAVAGSSVIYGDHFYLDLTSSFTANQPLTQWVVLPLSATQTEPRWGQSSSTFINTEMGYLMAMGSSNTGDGKNVLKNSTIVYSPSNQTWTTLRPPVSIPTSFALSTVIDKNGLVWMYGGLIPLDNQTSVLDGFYDDKSNSSNVTLPTQLYGINTKTWEWTTLSYPAQYQVRADHAAAITDDNQMYIVGGMTLNTDPSISLSRVYARMEQVLVFDTVQQNWQQITTNGPTPNQRRAFTLTYLPLRHQFVLYGGIFDTGNRATGRVPILDVCYTLDVRTSTWAPIDVQSQENNPTKLGSGQLYGHNSILFQTDLFIMFGVDEHNDYRGDVNILDTLTWQWKPTHEAAASIWTIPMIIGLVLGILLAIVLVAGSIYYLRYRHRNDTLSPLTHKRSSKQLRHQSFVIDTTADDPRLQMGLDNPIYQASSTTHNNSDEEVATHRPHSPQQQTMSETLLGSLALAAGLTASRPMSNHHYTSESSFTSFSATTKPDQQHTELGSSPTTTAHTPSPPLPRTKPDGDS